MINQDGKYIFRAEHVGSFVRPKSLIEAARLHKAKNLNHQGFREVQDQHIAEIVAFQDRIGMPTVTDGEYRRAVWSAGVMNALDGMTVREEGVLSFKNDDGEIFTPPSPYAEKKLKRKNTIATNDFDYLRSLKPLGIPKVTMASPAVMHFFSGDKSFNSKVYSNREACFSDLAAIYQEEIMDLAKAGCNYLQLDDTALPCNCDENARNSVMLRGENPDELTDAYIRLINQSIVGRPKNMTIGLHMCRGNLKGMWMGDGGYEAIAEKLFNELDVDTFFMEYDNKRSGDFSPLAYLPKGKLVVLGLISTKQTELEDKASIIARIKEAEGYLPLDQLALSPQCGFSSGGGDGQVIDMSGTQQKLELITELALEIWGTT